MPQEHHVLRELGPQVVVGHGVAAVLDHHGLAVEPAEPGQRLDEGLRLGQRHVLAGAAGAHGRGHEEYAEFSCTYAAVRSVVLIVAACGPEDRSTVIVTFLGLQVHLGPVVAGAAVAADPDAVDGDAEALRLEGRVRGAHRGEHPSPVGVLPRDGALEQVRAGHGPAGGDRVLLAGRADHLNRDELAGPLGVGLQLAGQVGADLGQHRGELAGVRSGSRGPAGQQQHGVVGGHAAVGVQPVEGHPGCLAQAAVQVGRAQVGVGGEHAQHGGQARGEHAGSLGHPADRVAAGPVKRDLADRVGGPDRVGRGGAAAAGGVGQGGVEPAQQQVHGQPFADQAGGAHRDLARGLPLGAVRRGEGRSSEGLRQPLGGGVGVLESERPGAGVGAAGVERDGPDPAARRDLLRPEHRGGLDPVAGEHGRGGLRRPVVDHHGDVTLTGRFQAGRDTGRAESERGGDAHGLAPRFADPAAFMGRLR